jgi:hypothetical protein
MTCPGVRTAVSMVTRAMKIPHATTGLTMKLPTSRTTAQGAELEEGYHHGSDCNQFGQIVTVPPIQDSFPSVSTARGGIRYGGGSYVFPQVFNIPRSWGQGWGYPERHGRSPHASRPVAEGTPPPVRPAELMHPGVECVRNARGTCSMCGRQMARPWTHDEINRIVQLSDVNEGFDDN